MIRTRPTAPLTSSPKLPEPSEPRWNKIRALRRAIARGDYETDERWAVTLERMFERHPDLSA